MIAVNIRSRDGEYRVPYTCEGKACHYFTNDKADAIGTARAMYADPIRIRVNGRPIAPRLGEFIAATIHAALSQGDGLAPIWTAHRVHMLQRWQRRASV